MRKLCFSFAFTLVVLISTTASAQTVDEAFRADIEKLMTMSGASMTGAQLAGLVTDQFLDAMRKIQPPLPDRAVEIVREVFRAEFGKAFDGPDGMTAQLVPVYAKHFTHEEVRGLIAFYSTPLGQKSVKSMAVLVQEGAQVGQRWAETNMPRIQQVLMARLKAEGLMP